MSRAGYTDDYEDQWGFIMWRGQVASSIRGKRGQAFLKELVGALDAMPEKKLVAHDLKNDEGVCAIGCVGVRRGVDLEKLEPENYDAVAGAFGIAAPLVREIEFINDEQGRSNETPEIRWQRVRDWAVRQIKPEPAP